MRNRVMFAVVALLAAPAAFAQQDTEADQPKKIREVYRAVEEITFSPVEIIGETKKAPGLYVLSHGASEFPSFIEERASFKRDLAKSIRLNVKTAETATTK